jgi:hypothetical protein
LFFDTSTFGFFVISDSAFIRSTGVKFFRPMSKSMSARPGGFIAAVEEVIDRSAKPTPRLSVIS